MPAPLRGVDRTTALTKAVRLYLAGCTIQSTAKQIGWSYGTTRTLLIEGGVRIRPRGGTQ